MVVVRICGSALKYFFRTPLGKRNLAAGEDPRARFRDADILFTPESRKRKNSW
jgi:hypothetical protein